MKVKCKEGVIDFPSFDAEKENILIQNKLKMNLKISLLLTIELLAYSVASGQNVYHLNDSSRVIVNGTSNISGWTVEVTEFMSDFIMLDTLSEENGVEFFSQVHFKALVDKMISGRGAIMDGKVTKALKYPDHPFITYTSDSNLVQSIANNEIVLISYGKLSMAGIEKCIEVEVKGRIGESNESITFAFNKALKMSMFNITKPTAFFGELYTKDDIEVDFKLTYELKP